jgi:hypothetical protein
MSHAEPVNWLHLDVHNARRRVRPHFRICSSRRSNGCPALRSRTPRMTESKQGTPVSRTSSCEDRTNIVPCLECVLSSSNESRKMPHTWLTMHGTSLMELHFRMRSHKAVDDRVHTYSLATDRAPEMCSDFAGPDVLSIKVLANRSVDSWLCLKRNDCNTAEGATQKGFGLGQLRQSVRTQNRYCIPSLRMGNRLKLVGLVMNDLHHRKEMEGLGRTVSTHS